jgi:hypothetical protein
MNEYDWDWEKQNICEGFDHPDAPPTDTDEAARQLRAATALEYRLMLAHKANRKHAAAADVAATAGLAGTLPEQQVTQVTSQQAASSQVNINSGKRQVHSHSSSSSKSSSSRRSSSSSNSSSDRSSNSSGKPLSGQLASHEQGTGTLETTPPTWQQRLSQLQQLASVDDPTGPDAM